MLLAIDVGNTETVIGLFDRTSDGDGPIDRHLRAHWRVATVASRTPDEHVVLLDQLFRLEHLELNETVDELAVASSVPAVTQQVRRMGARWFSEAALTILGPGTKSGMPILYDNPREVGPDRIADAVGGYDLYPGPLVVVDLGTATVFDVVSAKGEYLGGAIAPGVAISLEALFAEAAALRSVELTAPRSVIGRSTVESIQSGVLYGFAGQVDGVVARILEEIGPATVIATGGLASLIAPHTTRIEHVEPWLTLHGLRVIHERNHPKERP